MRKKFLTKNLALMQATEMVIMDYKKPKINTTKQDDKWTKIRLGIERTLCH
jgi:hypothetical protein